MREVVTDSETSRREGPALFNGCDFRPGHEEVRTKSFNRYIGAAPMTQH